MEKYGGNAYSHEDGADRGACGGESMISEELRDLMIARFLSWQLPKSVCSDMCVTDNKYPFPRSGTCLLNREEAGQLIDHLFSVYLDRRFLLKKNLD